MSELKEEGSAEAKARRALHRQSRCVMLLPDNLEGKRVLDIGCRNGLGAFKIADRVGPKGSVVGTDPSEQRLERARAQASAHHWAGERWGEYLRFVRADGCALSEAGLEAEGFDVVVVNSVLNLEPDLGAALAQVARVLVPGGLLYHDAVLAEKPLGSETADTCRAAGNVFGCASTRGEFEDALRAAGFCAIAIEGLNALEPPEGDRRDDLTGERFLSAVVQARRV